ncbi:hypothetical protein [Faunimonas pinastri]|uniref:hypothetical protein n=1 Tax=Faunimonas pinastri TaxID=1855383 RepID=UPI001EECCACF|nr:hypothetical protein [Faunimonas pinastri]
MRRQRNRRRDLETLRRGRSGYVRDQPYEPLEGEGEIRAIRADAGDVGDLTQDFAKIRSEEGRIGIL